MKIALSDATGKLDRAWLVDCAEMITAVTSLGFRMPNGTSLAQPGPNGWDMRIYARAASGPNDLLPDECPLVALPSDPRTLGEHGEHFVQNGMPYGRWFPSYEDSSDEFSITVSHEAFEMCEDSECVNAMVTPLGSVLLRELCDPVEALWFPYTCKSGRLLRCSNAVLPGYFTGSGKFDLMGKLSHAEQIWQGGYQIVWDDASKQWTQTTNGQMRSYRARIVINSLSRCDRLNLKLAVK